MMRRVAWVGVVVLFAGSSGCARLGLTPRSGNAVKGATLERAWFERCLPGHVQTGSAQRPMLVAVVSPRMVGSLLEWPRMQREAIGMGFDVQVWRDPRVTVAEWDSVWSSARFQGSPARMPDRSPAGCLTRWAPIEHWPYVRVLLAGHMHPWPIWGVMPDRPWREVLRDRRAQLTTSVEGSP